MKTCDDCPGSTLCSGQNLYPVLVRVYDLYGAGLTDKFDILIALDDDDESILDRYTANVSHACWTKAALLARDAFSSFPWNLDALVDEAPELYALIVEKCPDDNLRTALSKRAFVKMCKDIVYV